MAYSLTRSLRAISATVFQESIRITTARIDWLSTFFRNALFYRRLFQLHLTQCKRNITPCQV